MTSPQKHVPWQVVSSRDIYSAKPWITLTRQQVLLPNGSVVNDYHQIIMPEYTVVFAETHDGRVIVERQYRHGIGEVTLMLPAGLKEEGEDPLQAAQRELLEETGYAAPEWRHLGSFVPNANYGCGKAHLYHALNVRPVGDPNAGDLEEIEILLLSKAELLLALGSGKIHAMSMATAIALATNPLLLQQLTP
jgi:ADP-ribose pyrophosphatase